MLKHLMPALVLTLLAAPAHGQSFLGKSAADWEKELEQKDGRARRNGAFALGKLGKNAVGAAGSLKKHLAGDTDASVREAAAFALGEIGRESLRILDDPDVVEVLAKALKDGNLLVRRSAACALGNFGSSAKAAQPALEAALADTAPVVRQNVAWALGRIGPGTVPTLRKALKDEDVIVRRDAAGSLGNLDPEVAKAALPELLDCCKTPNSELRFAALSVLIKLVEPEDKKAAQAIKPALEDPDLEVRQNAALAMANIGGADAAPAIPILIEALKQGDLDLQRQAAAAIANIGPDAQSAVAPLCQALSAPDRDLRRNAVLALGGIGPKAATAIPLLANLIGDPKEDKNVRMETAVTLNRFGAVAEARKTVPLLLQVLQDQNDDSDVRWRIMWALRVYKDGLIEMPGVLPAFMKVLGEPKKNATKMLRYDCAYMLGMLKGDEVPNQALDVLLDFLKDDSLLLYEKTAVKTGGAGAETGSGGANVKEQGKGDARVMAVAALTEVGPARLARRPDIVQQLRAVAANQETNAGLREKTKDLLDRLKK